MPGHDLQTREETHVEKFFDDLTEAPLDPEQVRLAKIEEVGFLHTFPVHEKIGDSEAKDRVRLDEVDLDKQRRCRQGPVGITEAYLVTAPNAQEEFITDVTMRTDNSHAERAVHTATD